MVDVKYFKAIFIKNKLYSNFKYYILLINYYLIFLLHYKIPKLFHIFKRYLLYKYYLHRPFKLSDFFEQVVRCKIS